MLERDRKYEILTCCPCQVYYILESEFSNCDTN